MRYVYGRDTQEAPNVENKEESKTTTEGNFWLFIRQAKGIYTCITSKQLAGTRGSFPWPSYNTNETH